MIRLITLILDWLMKLAVFIVKGLHLTLPVLYALTVFITNLIWHYLDDANIKILVMVGLGLCFLYSVFKILSPMFRVFKPKQKDPTVTVDLGDQLENVERFVMFEVKDNPNYVVKEFSNRYEVYERQGDNLAYIRTDYK